MKNYLILIGQEQWNYLVCNSVQKCVKTFFIYSTLRKHKKQFNEGVKAKNMAHFLSVEINLFWEQIITLSNNK